MGAMNGETFDTCVCTQLAPTLSPSDVVVWVNPNVHESPSAAQAMSKVLVFEMPKMLP